MSKLKVPVNARDHSLSPETAPITLVEYGDYQCPACGMAHPHIKRLIKSLGGDLCFVFRNFPLTQIHPYAFLGAMAAEAADLQGKFFPMHDLIFENQALLDPEGIFLLAQRLDLDLEKFQSDLNDDELKKRIKDDFIGGVRSGVNGTPGFFVNGEMYTGPIDAQIFREMLGESPRI